MIRHSSFSTYIAALNNVLDAIGHLHLGPKLVLTDHDVSNDHMIVQRFQAGVLTQEIQVRKQDVELSSSNPMTRYQLLSYILNQFKADQTA